MQTLKNSNGRLFYSVSLLGLLVGLTAGNFAYQLFTAQDWITATERSFFQFMALLAVWILGLINQSNP
jgi:hypothetical protein